MIEQEPGTSRPEEATPAVEGEIVREETITGSPSEAKATPAKPKKALFTRATFRYLGIGTSITVLLSSLGLMIYLTTLRMTQLAMVCGFGFLVGVMALFLLLRPGETNAGHARAFMNSQGKKVAANCLTWYLDGVRFEYDEQPRGLLQRFRKDNKQYYLRYKTKTDFAPWPLINGEHSSMEFGETADMPTVREYLREDVTLLQIIGPWVLVVVLLIEFIIFVVSTPAGKV